MAQVRVVVRGNEIEFEAEISAPDDPQAQPGAVAITVNFPLSGTDRTSTVLAATQGQDGKWRAIWDSGQAARNGTVEWGLQASYPVKAAAEGSFQLEANRANRP